MAKQSCTVNVLLFSALREMVGEHMLTLSLPRSAEGGPTGEHLLEELIERYPRMEAFKAFTRLAVNEAYVANTTTLHDGDTVALITPVSGG